MGSIILHRDEEGIYNIVDGQQRTLTFVLLALAIGVSCDCLNDKDFYPALSQLPVARRNLNNNLRYITDWLKMHGGDCKVKFKNALEKSLQVVVVCVDKRDYAFQLFDSQNVKGRRLEPHDLLKAYHLRELNEAIRLHPERFGAAGATLSCAAADFTLTYQGVIKEVGGATPANKNRTIEFRIYDGPTSDRVLWGRAYNVLLDGNGLFNTALTDAAGSEINGVPSTGLAKSYSGGKTC